MFALGGLEGRTLSPGGALWYDGGPAIWIQWGWPLPLDPIARRVYCHPTTR